MKDKILAALKQEYAYLGLGENLLSAQAETLANLGFVTDENLTAVIKAQESGLKAIQQANDKRVADALAKVNANKDKEKENLQKTAEEQQAELLKQLNELKAKSEQQTSELQKQADELKKQQELQKKLDELQKKAAKQNADFEKKKADLLALINGTPIEPPPVEPQHKDEKIKTTPEQTNTFDEAKFRKTIEDEWSKRLETIVNTYGNQMKEFQTVNANLAEQVQALVKENTDFKAQQAEQNRKNFILNKAHELGIPDWRINEGFSFANDANEETITNALTTVSNNIRANVLPAESVNVPLPTNNGTPDKTFFDGIAEKLVQNI
jgi:chromosome segregation ATPase